MIRDFHFDAERALNSSNLTDVFSFVGTERVEYIDNSGQRENERKKWFEEAKVCIYSVIEKFRNILKLENITSA